MKSWTKPEIEVLEVKCTEARQPNKKPNNHHGGHNKHKTHHINPWNPPNPWDDFSGCQS